MKKGIYAVLAVLVLVALLLGIFLGQARGNVTRLTSEVEALTGTLSEKEEQIETLTADAEEKAGQIETLTADAEEKAGQIEALTADVEAKDAEIVTLTTDAEEKAGQIETLTEDVEAKNAEIEALTAAAAEKDAEIENLAREADEIDAAIADMLAEAAELDELVNSLHAEVRAQDAEISALNAALEEAASAQGGTAEDLSAITEGTYNNTKRFISALKEFNLIYSVYTAKDADDTDQVEIRGIPSTSSGGVDYRYTIQAFFDSDNSSVHMIVWNLIDFQSRDLTDVQRAVNSLNETWRYVKFYADTTDNSVTAELDFPIADAPDTVGVLEDALLHLNAVLNRAYDSLIPFRK